MKANVKQTMVSTLFASLMASSLLLTGCGGGSSDPAASTTPTTGTTTISRGVITGFGSIYVNGIKFETNESEFSVDDTIETDQSNLKVGMVVTVNGSVNADGTTGTASFIQYDNELKGPISNISAYDAVTLERTFTILGETVTVNADTVFDDDADDLALTLETLADGNVVEVSGLTTAAGLEATHIEGQSATLDEYVAKSGKIEILGSITGFDDTNAPNLVFKIDDQLDVQLNSDTVEFDDLVLADLQDGAFVEVKGELDATSTVLVLNATKIESKTKGLGDKDVDDAEIEGVITSYDATAMTFEIQGQVINYENAVLFPTSLVLKDDITVEAEGSVVDGVLVADKIKRKGNKIKVEGAISGIDTVNETITFTFNSTDIVVRVNTQTELKVDGVDSATLADFAVGDFVKMKAFNDGTTTINAVELKKKDTDDDNKVEAAVESFDATNGTVTVLGVVFDLSAADFVTDNNSNPVDASFYSALSIGEFVELKDNQPSDGIIDEIGLDD